jgi:Fur family ferric uptake transcriptional regulator
MATSRGSQKGPSAGPAPRMTAQRRAIGEVADSLHEAFSIEDLCAAVRRVSPKTSRATVYRWMASMAASGLVEQVGSAHGAALYARCHSGEHHHHLVCTSCGRVEEAECHLEQTVQAARERSGFLVTGHDLNLYGLCGSCAGNGGAA